MMTTKQVAARFNELAMQEKWFEIQDELFAEDVRSVEPEHSPYFMNASGKNAVKQKGEAWVARITGVNETSTTEPAVGGDYFAVGRKVDITVEGHGRVALDQVMLYHVQNGKIVSETFFY